MPNAVDHLGRPPQALEGALWIASDLKSGSLIQQNSATFLGHGERQRVFMQLQRLSKAPLAPPQRGFHINEVGLGEQAGGILSRVPQTPGKGKRRFRLGEIAPHHSAGIGDKASAPALQPPAEATTTGDTSGNGGG